MRRFIRNLDRTLLDAGGPIMIVLLIGVPILLVLIIVALVALAVHLIGKESEKNGSEDPPA